MKECAGCALSRSWQLSFRAAAEEVAGLRRLVRLRLELWELPGLSDAAQLCVTELVANVVKHVGPGTPVTLAVRVGEARLRIEVYDPAPHVLPTLIDAGSCAEGGRGMALIDAISERWGVDLTAESKATWCELVTPTEKAGSPAAGPRMTRVANLMGLYASAVEGPDRPQLGRLGAMVAEETVINVIADLLYWLDAHGRDPDEVLERAQAHFEAEGR